MHMRFVYLLWLACACVYGLWCYQCFAAPGDCDQACREVFKWGFNHPTEGYYCKEYRYSDCDPCTTGGCPNNWTILGGICLPTGPAQEMKGCDSCAFYCNPQAGSSYLTAASCTGTGNFNLTGNNTNVCNSTP